MKDDELEIDLGNLHEEWARQPKLYLQYADMMAEARKNLEDAKREQELVEAKLKNSIRINPSAYGLEKVTEDAIKSAMIVSEKYQKAYKDVINARYEMDIVDAMLSSLDHKKKGLESAVQLHLAGYFAEPKAPKGCKEEIEMEQKKTLRKKGQYSLPK